jgi:hypothetical protein
MTLISSQAVAQEDDEPGLFGNIILGGGWKDSRISQLEVTDDNKTVSNLDERGEYKSEAIPVIFGSVGYRFAQTSTQISVDLQPIFEGGIELLLAQPLGDTGTVSVTGAWSVNKAWKDPYLVGVKRSATDETKVGFGVGWEEIMGSGAEISYFFESLDVKDDVSGAQDPLLRRDGAEHSLLFGYALPLSQRSVVTPSFSFHRGDFKGKSNSFNGYQFSLEHFLGLGRWIFNTSAEFTWYDFEKEHPLFDKKRKDTKIGASEFITYLEPFGWRGFSLNGLVSYESLDSNINFFDASDLIIGLGVGYNF